jgi:hypothetical protein
LIVPVVWAPSRTTLPSAPALSSALSRIEAGHSARFDAFENSKHAILLEYRNA